MGHTILRWIGDEHALAELVAGFPTLALVVLLAACIVILSKGAGWMIDGAVHLACCHRIENLDNAAVVGRAIKTGDHCFGCTAGAGSSCSGALVKQDP